MMGFTLSKLNLLILVTATFAIMAYFMFGLTDVMINNAAQQTVSSYSEKAAAVITSDSLCFRTAITIPKEISYFGGIESSKRFFYLMHISRWPEQYDTDNPEFLISVIFAISDSKDVDKLRAASRVDVNAEVLLYDWNPTEMDVINDKAYAITLDPQSAVMAKDSFVIVKEVLKGKNYLHIIACSSEGTCNANRKKVGCLLNKARGERPFCFFEPGEEMGTC